jgi:N-acetyl-anhydromuramyl-L-alanine amidase AmpD
LVSCHYVVWPNWEVWKIWNDSYIMWHAWNSSWWSYSDMNNYSLWIEVVWPNTNWWFSDAQYNRVCELVIYLAELHKIPKQNILRHKDIAPGRKVDIADSFWSNKFTSFGNYINFLFDKTKIMSKYTDLLNKAIASWYVPLFDTRDWDKPLTEKETKELIELAFARFINRINWKG